VYAKKIADEGFRNKAEELIKELFGPVYWSVFVLVLVREASIEMKFRRPGMVKEDNWNPMLVGHWKRDLLKEVLQVFGEPSVTSLNDPDFVISS